jgi:hypothetical protein
MKPPILSKEDREKSFEQWLETLPKSIADDTRSLFPGIADCYRLRGKPGHFFMYKLSLYSDDIVRCVIVHGKDSHAPGMARLVLMTDLEKCDCGRFEPPKRMLLVAFATPDVFQGGCRVVSELVH